jgi:hypothetical protein
LGCVVAFTPSCYPDAVSRKHDAGNTPAVWPLKCGGGPDVSLSTESYSALMVRVRALDGSVLTADEAQRIRDAADARLFGDPNQLEISTSALDLLESLVEAARLSSRTSNALAEMLSEIESVSATS